MGGARDRRLATREHCLPHASIECAAESNGALIAVNFVKYYFMRGRRVRAQLLATADFVDM
jgi:hypothetical protein